MGQIYNHARKMLLRLKLDRHAFLFLCRRRGGWLIDATRSVTALHQSHSYASHLSGKLYMENPEGLRNKDLAGRDRQLNWKNATHCYLPEGLRFYFAGLSTV